MNRKLALRVWILSTFHGPACPSLWFIVDLTDLTLEDAACLLHASLDLSPSALRVDDGLPGCLSGIDGLAASLSSLGDLASHFVAAGDECVLHVGDISKEFIAGHGSFVSERRCLFASRRRSPVSGYVIGDGSGLMLAESSPLFLCALKAPLQL